MVVEISRVMAALVVLLLVGGLVVLTGVTPSGRRRPRRRIVTREGGLRCPNITLLDVDARQPALH